MLRVRRRVRNAIALVTALCVLLVWCPTSFAVQSSLDISQYVHKAWRTREGFLSGIITSIAQTPDGYLWLGTELGVVRFDGIRGTPLRARADESLPSNYVRSLLGARDGTLWIGTLAGLSSWKNGRLTSYAELAGFTVDALLEDRQGTIWAGAQSLPRGRLCSIDRNGSTDCHGDDGIFGRFVESVYEDHDGNLWLGTHRGLWQWTPEPLRRLAMNEPITTPQALLEDDNGKLMISNVLGITRLIDGKFVKPTAGGNGEPSTATRMLRDRNGGLWFGTFDKGLLHMNKGRTDTFTQLDGLSGNSVTALFEDREGNIWVATSAGLDRFRESAITTLSPKQGMASDVVWSVLATRDGSVWMGTRGGLSTWRNGAVSFSGTAKRDEVILSLFQDKLGRIWSMRLGSLSYWEKGKLIPIPGVPGGQVRAIAEDTLGNVWISNLDLGLIRLSPDFKTEIIPWTTFGHEDPATALLNTEEGLWVGFTRGGILHFANGKVRKSYGAAEGLGAGRVGTFHLDPDGTLWAPTQGGLSLVKNGRVTTLTSKDGLPCDGAHWMVEDDDHFIWLYTPCGLLRIARQELQNLVTSKPNEGRRPTLYTLFDVSDGVQNSAIPGGYFPIVSKSHDGNLWFINGDTASRINTRLLPDKNIQPAVHVEQIVADREAYDILDGARNDLRLPAQTRDVVIEYTALNLGAPEKTRFRYKLENRDRDWQDAGNRRYALYGDLSPGNYRFRVTAANESGVWNEADTSFDFSVDPAYYQTTWFRLTVIAGVLALLAGLYQLRLRNLRQQYNIRLEERVNERTRIARDLHDTLLQSFQGALLKFYAVGYQLPEGSEAKESLDRVIEQVRDAIAEGRDALQGLRTSRLASSDLGETISVLAKAIGDQIGGNTPDFRLQIEGTARRIQPAVLDEIYQFANEGLRNAFQHALAKRIEVEILFDRREFRLRIRDDGKGIHPAVLREGGRPGHYGLTGMYERAKQMGGNVAVWSEVDSGSEVELTIPARIAYAKSRTKRWPKPW